MPLELLLALGGGIATIVAAGVGIVAGVYQVKKMGAAIERDQENSQRHGDQRILMPTLEEIIRYGGNARAYQAGQEERDRERSSVHGSAGPFGFFVYIPLFVYYFLSGKLLADMFSIAIPEHAQLAVPHFTAVSRARILLRFSGGAFYVSLALVYFLSAFVLGLDILGGFPVGDYCIMPGFLCFEAERGLLAAKISTVLMFGGFVPLGWCGFWKMVFRA